MAKAQAANKLIEAESIQCMSDESPDLQGQPVFVSCFRNLKTGENLVTGLKTLAAKRAIGRALSLNIRYLKKKPF